MIYAGDHHLDVVNMSFFADPWLFNCKNDADQRAFASGATLAELEQYIAYLRSLGAPGDAHPKIGVNDDYEVTMMICVVERPALNSPGAS
jgi:hypothetical protein